MFKSSVAQKQSENELNEQLKCFADFFSNAREKEFKILKEPN